MMLNCWEIWEGLPAEEKIHENEEIKLSDFFEQDKRLETGGSFTLEDIAEEMLSREKPVESEDDELTVEEETISFEMPSEHGALFGSLCSREARNWVRCKHAIA